MLCHHINCEDLNEEFFMMEAEVSPKTREIFYQTTLHHTQGCSLNLRPIQDTNHQYRTCPRDNTSLNYQAYSESKYRFAVKKK